MINLIVALWRRTRSAANAGNRSFWSSAQRYSIATLRPSIKPASAKPRRNAASGAAYPSAVVAQRNPITGIVACCARTASGQAVANVPITLKRSRRRIAFIKALKTAPTIAYDDVITAGIDDRRNGVDGSI